VAMYSTVAARGAGEGSVASPATFPASPHTPSSKAAAVIVDRVADIRIRTVHLRE